ncbi:BNR domain-containing protein [Pseudomonas sp. PCH199]|uniref:WD40/YVTN/BNR-like repeat-containing protein n=1 Tax=unclassified Pseudomonas TaxID=196821 RepID=UPI000BC7E7EF|nr:MULTISPECIES: YCF48-related protein [unclassified Pseudomonas]MCW8277864.1 BNR domain-containing protein [Pseudomonas sp. PCH199]PAM82023.1 BNR domain-containing protein [Pseudomonas sp. ERMR1:02]
MKITPPAKGLMLALVLSANSLICQAAISAVGSPLNTPAMHVTVPSKAVLIDLARAGQRLVAVGERGVVLLSDDDGQSWRQVPVPVSVSLTAVQFVDAQHGWALGHAGVVLATVNGGEQWAVQLSGLAAANIELDNARKDEASALDIEAADLRIQNAERLIADGPDKPFLALHFSDAKRGLIAGAYGMLLETTDGGASWNSRMGKSDNPAGAHLYAIAKQGTHWFIVGEQGYMARSDDDGQSFVQLESPYEGSFFTAQLRDDGALVVAGLKGHAFLSRDAGQSFELMPAPMPVSFSDATRLADGRTLLVNQAGALFFNNSQAGTALQFYGKPLGKPVTSVVQASDGSVVVAGFTGLLRIPQLSTAVAE